MNGLAVSGILAGILYFLLFNTTPIYFILFFIFLYFALSWCLIPSSASKYNSVRRKIQISTWSDPVRPTIMGYFQVNVSNTLNYLHQVSKSSNETITMTHLVTKATAMVLSEHPEAIGKIAFGNYISSTSVDATMLVSLDEGTDLYSIRLSDIPNKPLSTLATEVKEKSQSLREGELRQQYKKSTQAFEKIPTCVVAVLMEVLGFVVSVLGIPLPMFHLQKNHFGSFIVSSAGRLGGKVCYPPLVPVSRCPLIVYISSIFDEAVVREGKVEVQKVMNVCCTVDHRFVDGMKALTMQNKIKDILENPIKYLGNN